MRSGGDPGPPDDLAAFYADQYPRVRGALALLTGDRRLAEELAQEAFVRTCQHWEKVRTMDAPGAWVHRVGVNLALSRARRRRTELRVVTRRAPDAHAAGADAALADEALAAALAALPADERATLVLRFHADLSVAQVASALGVPEGTVKTRTRRALATLRAAGVASDDDAEADAEVAP
jgi:RNA polymerase sigma-70 factor (sigma-E family)